MFATHVYLYIWYVDIYIYDFDVLKWISNCKKHLWPPPRSGQHKVSEDSVMLDIARHIVEAQACNWAIDPE